MKRTMHSSFYRAHETASKKNGSMSMHILVHSGHKDI